MPARRTSLSDEVLDRIRRWRALPDEEKTRRRRAAVVDQVVGSMAMEGQPVSADWEGRAREAQAARLSRDDPDIG